MHRGFASMFSVIVLSRVLAIAPLPATFNIFQAMGTSSPLFTHTLPLGSMAVSVAAAGILFFFVVRIAQKQEF